MSHIRLFEHSRAAGADGLPALEVVGDFPNAAPSAAYEGRISILNAGGDCTVQQLTGTLPPGAALFVDNATKEVVVTWPAYQATAAPIANPGFEAGDMGWEKGAGWTITTGDPPTGAKCGQFFNAGGSSIIANTARAACSPGQAINASCNVRQGASSAGNAGACVRLEFFDAAGVALLPAEGNMVDSGSDGAVHPSTVSAIAPVGTAEVRIAGRGFRKRQNRKLYIDDFAWDVTQAEVGTNVVGMWCISLRVRDSLGREAEWSGCIQVTEASWLVVSASQTPAAGTSFYAGVSSDGVDWSNPLVDALGGELAIASDSRIITYYGGTFSGSYTDDDGASWNTCTGPSLGSSAGNGIYFAGKFWVPTRINGIQSSATGIDGWSAQSIVGFDQYTVCARAGLMVVAGSNGRWSHSTDDGTSWSVWHDNAFPGLSTGAQVQSSATNGTRIIFGGFKTGTPYPHQLSYTDNGTSCTLASTPFSGTAGTTGGNVGVTASAYSPTLGIFVCGTSSAGAITGEFAWSIDGANWTLSSDRLAGDVHDIAWAGDRFIAVGSGGSMAYSLDGKSWTPIINNFGSATLNSVVALASVGSSTAGMWD